MKSNHGSYRILAIMLALMIFTSSSGLSIDMHFCQGHLRSLSVIGDAKSCVEKENAKNSACKLLANATKRNCCPIGCCTDKEVVMDLSFDLPVVQDAIFNVQQEVVHFAMLLEQIVQRTSFEKHLQSPIQYKPPKIPKRIYNMIESYML